MTNQEAIKKYEKIKNGNIYLIHQRTEGKEVFVDYSLCDMAIKALKEQEWIPCDPSELPKDKKLWVTHDGWGCRYVDDVFWDMTEWSDNVSDVVAYMPYTEPEPYKEEVKYDER